MMYVNRILWTLAFVFVAGCATTETAETTAATAKPVDGKAAATSTTDRDTASQVCAEPLSLMR